MYRNHTIAVVVPAYNEENLISRVIEMMPDYVDRIVVVDDCSQDGMAETVRRHLPQMNERLHLVQHETNQGVGGAIATGYKWCRDHEMDVAVVMAGDAQMDPADMGRAKEPLD